MFTITFTNTLTPVFIGPGNPTILTPVITSITTTPPVFTPTGGITSVTTTTNTGTVMTGGNTTRSITQIEGGGEIPNEAKRRGMGVIGKVVCGLFIAATLRKLWNFIFKTKPKNAVGIIFNGKEVNKTGQPITNIVDAVLDNFDVTTKIQNLFDTIGDKLDGSGVGSHCTLYLHVNVPSDPSTLPETMDGASIDDFTSAEPEAFDTWKSGLSNAETASVSAFLTAFSTQSNLGQLMVLTTTKKVEDLRKKFTSVNGFPLVTTLRFQDQTGSGYVVDPQCLVSVSHLPKDVIEQIVGDEELFRALLGKTRSKYDQSNCNNDCGQLLIEVCPCYSSDTCAGYKASEKTYDKKSCACMKTKMEVTFESEYYTQKTKGSNAGKSENEIVQLAGGNYPNTRALWQQKMTEKYNEMYFGYKTVITVESDADEGLPVYTPVAYALEDDDL